MTRKPAAVLLVLSLAVLALALVPAAGIAAKGGNSDNPNRGGGNGNGGGGASATLTVSPTTVASGDAFTGSGCGYVVGEQANVVVTSPTSQTFFNVAVDEAGCIWFRDWTGGTGEYLVQTYQSANGNKQSLMASASLTVV